MRTSSLVLLTFLGACGTSPPAASSTSTTVADACGPQAGDAVGKAPGFGERCDPAIGCDKGLTCQDSEFSTHPWCTRACSKVQDHCDAVAGEPQGFCVQMPSGWRGPTEPFCVPECGTKAACKTISADWETCGKLVYKNGPVPGYSTLASVCLAPSAHGAPFVDPQTCAFEGLFDGSKFDEAKVAAKDYCLFLGTCQLRSSCTSPQCCAWHAFQYLTPDGKDGSVRNDRIAQLKCYPQSYKANEATPRICSAWQDDCTPLPVQ